MHSRQGYWQLWHALNLNGIEAPLLHVELAEQVLARLAVLGPLYTQQAGCMAVPAVMAVCGSNGSLWQSLQFVAGVALYGH